MTFRKKLKKLAMIHEDIAAKFSSKDYQIEESASFHRTVRMVLLQVTEYIDDERWLDESRGYFRDTRNNFDKTYGQYKVKR